MPKQTPPAFLAELMTPSTGEVESSDVFARFDTAVEKAFLHVTGLVEMRATSEVSVNEQGTVDGVGFFDESHELVACVTVYMLEHDSEEPRLQEIRAACQAPPVAMQATLNQLLAERANKSTDAHQ